MVVAVAVAGAGGGGGGCSSNLTPSLGTSIRRTCDPKKAKAEKKKRSIVETPPMTLSLHLRVKKI